jgi:tetratricopeptide (TPR) repeat protein
VDLTPAGHESLPCVLHNLGNSLQARFQRTGNSCDVYRATEAHQKAVNIAPVGFVELPLLLENLGNSDTCRFQCTNNISDINTAVAVHQRAAELSSPRRAGLFGSFSYLGTSLLHRFGHLGNPSDLEQAVAAHARAVELTPSGHTDLPRWLFNLSSSLQARFEHFGNLHDIAEAISANQKAVKLTPDRHALLPIYLRSLGKSLMRRFEHMGNLSDIDAAISLQQRAVGVIPRDHAAYTDLQSSLGNSLLTRFDRTGKLSDIDAAILAQQEAVQLTSSGSPSLYYALSSLGVSLRRRFESSGNSLDISDIDEAVAAHQRAHHLIPTGHNDLPAILHNYGSSLLRRSKHTKDISDILKALEVHQKAVELASTGLPSLPKFKTSLGHSFSSRGEFTGNRDDLAAGMGHYKSAATCGFGSPLLRMKAARCWIQSSCNLDLESPQTLAACDTAIGLISEVAGLEQTVQCRHAQLQELTGLVDDISALGCILGRTDKALEWLEQGRCLVWAQLSLLRTPFDDLRTHNIELAQQFMHVSRQLDIASSRPDVSWSERSIVAQISIENEAQLHFKLSKEWKELLYLIRSTVPGLKNFLRPSPCSNLLQNLPDGPLVLFSIHPARCDALALRRGFDEPFHIQLPDFSRQEADIYCKDLKTHLQQNNLRMRGGEQETELIRGLRPHRERGAPRRVLAGLWNKVVKPILDALEFSVSNVDTNYLHILTAF